MRENQRLCRWIGVAGILLSIGARCGFASPAADYAHPESLVTTEWVAAHTGDREIRLIDVRRSGYESGHIPGALAFDPESIRDAGDPPTFLLAPRSFEESMKRLGVSAGTRVILYDDRGGLLAARLWWALNAYGHANVALVNGGWVKWTAEKRPETKDVPVVPAGRFMAKLQRGYVATVDDVRAAIDKQGARIIDARTVAEMDGSDTRLSNRRGVIPSAIPVYWEDLLDPEKKTLRTAAELAAIYAVHGVKPTDEVIAYCWVGHRSAVDLFALHLIGHHRFRNYLGSWEEWSRRMDLPTAALKK